MSTGIVDPRNRILPPIVQLLQSSPHEKITITQQQQQKPRQTSSTTSTCLVPSSHTSSTVSSSREIPPLQGYDPPRPLHTYDNNRNNNVTSGDSLLTTSHHLRGSWRPPFGMTAVHTTNPAPAPRMTQHPLLPPSPIMSCESSPPPLIRTPPPSFSNTITTTTTSSSTPEAPASYWDDQEDHEDLGPPNTEIVVSDTGEAILKCRRGRPPTSRRSNALDGGWRFLAPTVWNVQSPSPPQAQSPPSTKSTPSLGQQHTAAGPSMRLDDNSQDSHMTAFTGSDMDTVLPMPRKKRGRKPKRHFAGNSCFVWKDIPSARPAAPKKTSRSC